VPQMGDTEIYVEVRVWKNGRSYRMRDAARLILPHKEAVRLFRETKGAMDKLRSPKAAKP
jgi:hypothetical protein